LYHAAGVVLFVTRFSAAQIKIEKSPATFFLSFILLFFNLNLRDKMLYLL